MPPNKRPGKELSLKGPSQAAGGQVHDTTQTTTQLQTFAKPRPVTAETRRPREPPEQPPTHVEVPVMNTSTLSTQQQSQHQEMKAQEDQQ
jgi:hypothetical protein